jgi:hypothetical protein
VKTTSKAKKAATKTAPSQKGAPTKKAAAAKKGAPTKKATAAKKSAPARKAAPSQRAPAAKKTVAKKAPAAKKAAPSKGSSPVAARRADFGAPIDGFFAKHPPHLRAILVELRALVEEAVPDATASIKWGMPNYSIGKSMVCALAGFRSHVNLIVAGPPEIFDDPGGLLDGDAKTGRHMKLRTIDELPRDAVRGWVHAAAQNTRANAR